MAEAVVEERQLLKKLRWWDGFVIALATPGFLLGSLGYSVGDIGGWGSVLLWGISAGLAFFIMTLYAEMAAMFPDKPGGFPLYAHEGWRKYFTLVGPDRHVRLLARLVGRARVPRSIRGPDHHVCLVPGRAVRAARSSEAPRARDTSRRATRRSGFRT